MISIEMEAVILAAIRCLAVQENIMVSKTILQNMHQDRDEELCCQITQPSRHKWKHFSESLKMDTQIKSETYANKSSMDYAYIRTQYFSQPLSDWKYLKHYNLPTKVSLQ